MVHRLSRVRTFIQVWWLICAMSYKHVFGAKTRKVATRKPAEWWFWQFSHGDLSPRQAKIRPMVAENTKHGMSRTFVWWGEKSPCENTKKSPFGGFSRGALSPRKHAYITWYKSATKLKSYLQDNEMVQFISCMPTTVMQVSQQEGEHLLEIDTCRVDYWKTTYVLMLGSWQVLKNMSKKIVLLLN